MQQGQPIAVEPRQGEVVHRRDHGEPVVVAEAGDQFERLLLVADVEGAGGLVEQQDRRLLGEGTGDDEALLFAAAQRAESPIGELAEVEPFEDAGHHRPVVARR